MIGLSAENFLTLAGIVHLIRDDSTLLIKVINKLTDLRKAIKMDTEKMLLENPIIHNRYRKWTRTLCEKDSPVYRSTQDTDKIKAFIYGPKRRAILKKNAITQDTDLNSKSAHKTKPRTDCLITRWSAPGRPYGTTQTYQKPYTQ